MTTQLLDAVLVGGGPANLSGALALGRARRHILLADAGPRRNAAARRVHNLLTRDGIPPDELRHIAREQLGAYPSVEVVDQPVMAITGQRDDFEVQLPDRVVRARRILLGTGMIDTMLPIEGFAERWGHAIYQCPYCHGWEVRDRPWGFVVTQESQGHWLAFALQALQWTDTLTVFTQGAIEVTAQDAQRLSERGIRLETASIARLLGAGQTLEQVALRDGTTVACEALYAHPPQRHVPLIESLGLELDEAGYVRVDELRRETSRPGIYATGDLTTRMQGAVLAAALGSRAAAMINVELAMATV